MKRVFRFAKILHGEVWEPKMNIFIMRVKCASKVCIWKKNREFSFISLRNRFRFGVVKA